MQIAINISEYDTPEQLRAVAAALELIGKANARFLAERMAKSLDVETPAPGPASVDEVTSVQPPPPPVAPWPIPAPAPEPTAAFAPPPAAPDPLFPPTPDRDKRGLPWDGRIHSSSKALLADGTWRQRRNTDPELIRRVEAELMGAVAAPPPPVPAPAPVATTTPPPPPVPAPAPAPLTAISFPALMQFITKAVTSPEQQAYMQGKLQAALASVGLNSLPQLAARPDLVNHVAKEMGALS